MIIKVKPVTYYFFEIDGKEYKMQFVPIKDAPGFTHRVLILDASNTVVKKDWLGEGYNPNAKHAAYYASKHFDPNFR